MIRATVEAAEIAQVAAGILMLMILLIVVAEVVFRRRARQARRPDYHPRGPIQRPERYQREAERRVR